MIISIIIRTYNEERYLNDLLNAISNQNVNDHKVEIIIVDSGSTDKTLEIANSFNCTIKKIEKVNFSFGRSLNLGCITSNGEILIFISGHCIPANEFWLQNLINPIIKNEVILKLESDSDCASSEEINKKILIVDEKLKNEAILKIQKELELLEKEIIHQTP